MSRWFSQRPLSIDEQLSEMQRLQQLRALKSVNEMADRCFDVCVTDFGFTKSLRPQELDCLDKCVEKYLAMSFQSGQNFERMYGRALPATQD
jgi:hypothetical protein